MGASMRRSNRGRRRAAPRRIVVAVETIYQAGRNMLWGVIHHAREAGWEVHYVPPAAHDRLIDAIRAGCDGVLCRIFSVELHERVRDCGLPLVELGGLYEPSPHHPRVQPDNIEVGRLAARHLLDRARRPIAFVGLEATGWSRHRCDGFYEACEGHPAVPPLLLPANVQGVPDPLPFEPESRKRLAAWVTAIPAGGGVYCANDVLGFYVLEVARELGMAVPEHLAVVGTDNDMLYCEISSPPMTSVDPNHARVGRQAAALLDRILDGDIPPGQPVLIPPAGVVVRRSSDAWATRDPVVLAALNHIRDGPAKSWRIHEIARSCNVSASVLKRRVRAALGRSVHALVLQHRLERAVQMLKETDASIATIADACGFRHPEYMSALVRKRLGVSPRELRRRASQARTAVQVFC